MTRLHAHPNWLPLSLTVAPLSDSLLHWPALPASVVRPQSQSELEEESDHRRHSQRRTVSAMPRYY